MKKNATAKVFAAIALFWIIIWIIGTAILFIVQWWATPQQAAQVLTEEELQEIIDEAGVDFGLSGSWDLLEIDAFNPEVSDETIEENEDIIVEEAIIQE